MSINASTSRRITYMYCRMNGLGLRSFFFSKKYFNRKFPILKNIYFPLFFQTLLCFIYINETIVEKPNLNFFEEFFQSLNVL